MQVTLSSNGQLIVGLDNTLVLLETILYGYVYNGALVPQEGVTIRAVPSILGPNIVTALNATLSSDALLTTTDSTGLWNLTVLAPQAVVAGSLVSTTFLSYTIIIDALGLEPMFIPLDSFSSSLYPVSIATLVNTSLTLPTVPMIGYLADATGTPIVGAFVTATLSDNSYYVPDADITVSSEQTITAYTDANGFYSIPLIPSSKLLPYGRYYTIIEGNYSVIKYIMVPDSGGFIWNSVIAVTTNATTSIPSTSVSADFREGSSFTVPLISDSIIVNLNNIRYVLDLLSGTSWDSLITSPITPLLLSSGSSGPLSVPSLQGKCIIANKIGSELNNINSAISEKAGVGARVNYTTNGNKLHGIISFTTGYSDWCSGDQIDIYFDQPVTDITQATIQLTLASTTTAAQINNVGGVYVIFSLARFSINFTRPDTTSTTYTFFYQIDGIV